jgi:hypothetical protein
LHLQAAVLELNDTIRVLDEGKKARGTWMQWIPISICNSSKVLCQVEAMKTALDWRALVADVLTMERRSQGTRWANTQQSRDNIKKMDLDLWWC